MAEDVVEATAELAGFFAAHGIWCVVDGEVLIPMQAFELADGSRQMQRLVTDDFRDVVVSGRQCLVENPGSALRAVLVYDSFIHVLEGKTDALIIEAVRYGPETVKFTMAVPYRNASHPEGFAVDRPKFLGFEGSAPDFDALGRAFYRGVDRHENGAKVWNARSVQDRPDP